MISHIERLLHRKKEEPNNHHLVKLRLVPIISFDFDFRCEQSCFEELRVGTQLM